MATTTHPWQNGPTELVSHAISHLHRRTDFDQRLAFLLLDVGIETLFKTYLLLPDSVTRTTMKYDDRKKAAEGGFHGLVQGVGQAAGPLLASFNLAHIEFYHEQRNKLYHQGNGITVPPYHVQDYADKAVAMLRVLLDFDLTDELSGPRSMELSETDYQRAKLQRENELNETIRQVRSARRRVSDVSVEAVEYVHAKMALPSFRRHISELADRITEVEHVRMSRVDEHDDLWQDLVEVLELAPTEPLAQEVTRLMQWARTNHASEVPDYLFLGLLETRVSQLGMNNLDESWQVTYLFSGMFPDAQLVDPREVYEQPDPWDETAIDFADRERISTMVEAAQSYAPILHEKQLAYENDLLRKLNQIVAAIENWLVATRRAST